MLIIHHFPSGTSKLNAHGPVVSFYIYVSVLCISSMCIIYNVSVANELVLCTIVTTNALAGKLRYVQSRTKIVSRYPKLRLTI